MTTCCGSPRERSTRRSRFSSPLIRAGIALTALTILGLAATPANAATLPFADPNATSSIGLCDAGGNPITAGSMDTHAFVTAAAASSAAPDGYGSAQAGKATLFAFQPRKGVDPGEWSGFQLTGGSVFSDSAHPLVSGTNLDPSLREFTSAFPAKWAGLVQLRIYYTGPDKVVSRRTYPAAVVQVSGNRWTLVQGASLHCDLTKVVSSEHMLLPAAAFDSKHPAVSHPPTPAAAASAAGTVTASPKLSGIAQPTTAAAASSGQAAAHGTVTDASTKSNNSGTNPVWWVLGAVIVVAAAGAGIWRRLRTR